MTFNLTIWDKVFKLLIHFVLSLSIFLLSFIYVFPKLITKITLFQF